MDRHTPSGQVLALMLLLLGLVAGAAPVAAAVRGAGLRGPKPTVVLVQR